MLVLPWYVPLLILATSAVTTAAEGLPASSQLLLLAALSLIGLSLTPFAVAAALRISLSN